MDKTFGFKSDKKINNSFDDIKLGVPANSIF